MRSHSSILSSWRLLLAATACVSFSAHGFLSSDHPHHWPVAAVVQPRHWQSKNVRVFASTILTDVPSNNKNNDKVVTPTATVDAKLGNKRLAAGMAFLTAWADMVLNVRLQTFCTMMTGNLLWMIKAAAEFRLLDGVYYGLVMASYFAGLATYRSWQLSSSAKDTSSDNAKQLRFLPTVAASVALLFVVADTFLGHASGKFWQKWIPACLLSFGFSMINGVGSDTAGTMTFVVTGHMTKLANTMVDEYTAGKGMWNRFCKQPSVWMSSAVFGGFMGGALFANMLRLNGWTKLSGMGEFAWIGILMSGLFVWKDSILQRSSGKGWPPMKNPLASWFKASKSETAEPVAAESSAATSNQQEQETVDAKTLIDGTWYSDQELLDSTLATDLILSNPAIITIAPLNGTDWVSTTTTAELLLAGDNAINATDSRSSSGSSSESTAA